MDKEQAKQFLRLQEHDKFFVSLLQELGCHSDFVAFDKSTRGHDLLAITERMSALLERIPGWNRLRIVVANRYISENRYDEALSILEPGLEFSADLADVQVLVFKIYARNKDQRARDFLNLLGPRFLRNQQGLLALIAYDSLLETFEDFTLCTNIAAYLCSKAIPLPSEFYRFVFD